MKRVEKNFKILVAIVLALAISYSLMAQPRQGRMQKPGDGLRMEHPIPDLTDEQKSRMKEIHLATLKEAQPLKDELKINRARLNALVKNDNPDMGEVRSIVKANADNQVKLQMLMIESKIDTRKLLTEEQKIIFDARGEKMRRHRNARQIRQTLGPRERPEIPQKGRRI